MCPPSANVARSTELLLTFRGSRACLRESQTGIELASDEVDLEVARAGNLHQTLNAGYLSSEAVKDHGIWLASRVCPPLIREAVFRACRLQKVLLRIDATGTDWAIPWELMWIGDGPIALSPNLHVVRDAGTTKHFSRKRSGHARALVVMANPGGSAYPMLTSAEAELRSVLRALGESECRKWRMASLANATFRSVQEELSRHAYDVVHFIGHAEDTATGGRLIFEGDEQGNGLAVYAEDLLPSLEHAGVGLIVLSACSTGGAWSSIGSELARSGVSAVIGMQFPMIDQAAYSFSRAFYASLLDGLPIEEAVSHGRHAIRGYGASWAAPVLMLGAMPEVKTEPVRSYQLPLEDRPFVGRLQEREEVKAMLERPGTGIVTVTGMGGMGKTRLARQLTLDLEPSYPGGAWFVPCDTLGSRDELVAAIAAATGVPADEVSEEGISQALAGPRSLLILDCFEGLLEHRSVLTTILTLAPSARVLVTSRRRLDLAQEHEYKLQPMALPRRADRTADALELFSQAASQAKPGFVIDRTNRTAVKSLVKALEAIPLAIVLAAGRLRHMTVEELLAKVLEGRRMVVVSRRSSLDRRHDNLIQVLKDSFSLLSEKEREAINLLSVFRGGFTPADVEEAFGLEDAFDLITLLYDHSLLNSQVVERATRFLMLDTVRECIEFLEEHLEIASLDGYRKQHAEHYAVRARGLRTSFDDGEWSGANSKLWLDAGNYRAAIAFAAKSGDEELVRRLARSLLRIFFEVGVRADFDAIVPGAEAAARAVDDLPLLAELHGLQGEGCRREGRVKEMILHARHRADICRELSDEEGEADSVLEAADQAFMAEMPDVAREMLARFEGLDASRISKPVRASALLIEARMKIAEGDGGLAAESVGRAYELMRDVGVDRQGLYVWMHLSSLSRALGHLEQSESIARRLIRDGLTCMHYQSVGQGLFQLASTLEAKGDSPGAAEAIALALQIPKSISGYVRQESIRRWKGYQAILAAAALEQASAKVAGDWKAHAERIGASRQAN